MAPARQRAINPALRTIAIWMLLLYVGVGVASFLKGDLPRNDFERFDDLRLTFTFFGLSLGLCAAYVAIYRSRPAVTQRTVMIISGACAMLLLASYPVGSKDVFGYAFYGKIWGTYHANPYVATPADFPADPWQPFVQVRWRNWPVAYGPLFLWQSWLINALAGDHLWRVIWLNKAWSAAAFLASVGAARAILLRTACPAGAPIEWLLLLLAWNPVLLFESAGGAHNDVIMVLLWLCALWCWRGRRPTAAACVLALSVWYKWYSVLLIPACLVEALKSSGVRAATRLAAAWAACVVLSGAILFAPLAGSLPAVFAGLLHPAALRGIYPAELSPPLAATFWILRAGGLFETDLGFRLFDVIRFSLFGMVVGWSVLRQWRSAPSFGALVESGFLISAAFFLLLVTMLLPWHLATVIVLGVVCGREPFLSAAVILTVLAMLSYFLTFAGATVLLAVLLATLWLLRRLGPAVGVGSAGPACGSALRSPAADVPKPPADGSGGRVGSLQAAKSDRLPGASARQESQMATRRGIQAPRT